MIKREISSSGDKDKFTLIIDFIKDEDQNDKILRLFFIENLTEAVNSNEINLIKNNDPTVSNAKTTLVTLFLPIEFYCEFSKSTLITKCKDLFKKEISKKKNLFKSSMYFLDNMQFYFNNSLIQLNKNTNINNTKSKLSNLNNLSTIFDEKLNPGCISSQSNFSIFFSNTFKNKNEIDINDARNYLNLNNVAADCINDDQNAISGSYIDDHITQVEDLNIESKRKTTIQRFNEIGNRYSFSDAVSHCEENSDPLAIVDVKYPDFIDKSDVNVTNVLDSLAAESPQKSVFTEIPAANKINNEIYTANQINIESNSVNDNIINLENVNLNIENTDSIKKEEPYQNVDPVLQKENQEILKLLDNKTAEMDSFFNRDWKILEEKEGFKSFYLDEKSGLRSIKSHVVISKNIKLIAEYLEDLNKRSTYDKNFDNGKILRKIDEAHNLTYLKFKGKLMISSRDFVVCSRKETVK